ncbi:MAG: putative metal-binding motif-containing protein [Sandaracinaceae bacterium]
MTRRPIVSLAARVVLGLSIAALGLGNEFSGCTGREPPPTGGTLPATTGGCLVDVDCVSTDMCVRLVCVAGECVTGGLARDNDGDRVAPAPCGEDCDDFDSAVFPDAAERCNGRDDDCDGTTDEGASGIVVSGIEDGVEGGQLVGLSDGFMRVGLRAGAIRAISARRVDEAGAPSPDVVTIDVPDPSTRVIATASDGTTIHVVTGGDGPPLLTSFLADGSGRVGPDPIGTDGVFALDALAFAGQVFVVYDRAPGGERWLFRSNDPSAPLALRPSSVPPRLATDGTSVAVTDGPVTVAFFDPADGSRVGEQGLSGAFATGGLASGDGHVVAAYRDAFDHSLVMVTPSSVSPPTSAPTGTGGRTVELFQVADGLAVVRFDGFEISLSLVSADLSTTLASFTGMEITPFVDTIDDASAATDGRGLSAVATSHTASTGIAILACSL